MRPRLAVLPFAEFDDNSDLGYLSEGIANDIRRNLVTSPDLVLAGRASSASFSSAAFSPQKIRELLGVSHVVSGQLRQRGERLLVTVELTDTHTDTLLWSNRFDRSISELFTIERQIAADVLQSLNLKPILTSASDAVHPDAYAAYLLGQHIFFKDMVAAREQFLRALEIQPDFADAQAFVGWSHLDQGNFGLVPTIEAYPKAQASISRALAIDPANVNALLANSVINMALNHDYQTLLDTVHDVLKRDPTNERTLLIYGAILEVLDRSTELLRLSDYWLSVDPLNSEARRQRLAALIAADELSLSDIRQELTELGSLSARLAHSTMELALALRTKDKAGALKILQNFKSPGAQMMARFMEGDLQAARQLAQTVIADPKTMPQWRARAWLALGDVDKAAAVASKALDQGHIQILTLLRDSARAEIEPGLARPFFSGPVLDRLLRQAGLDSASMAQITVHPLPFDKHLWNR
jgi:TolB-like protein